MARRSSRPSRNDLKFNDELLEIKRIRFGNGRDKKPKSNRRITQAIRRHPLFPRIKKDIIEAKLDEDLE